MSLALKIKGEKKPFSADWNIIGGLYKTDKRNSIRSNVKNFKIRVVKADSKNNMGVGFHKLNNACIINLDVPSGRSFQLLVSKDMDVKEMKDLPDLNDTYKELISKAYGVALGKKITKEEEKGFLKKIVDAIF